MNKALTKIDRGRLQQYVVKYIEDLSRDPEAVSDKVIDLFEVQSDQQISNNQKLERMDKIVNLIQDKHLYVNSKCDGYERLGADAAIFSLAYKTGTIINEMNHLDIFYAESDIDKAKKSNLTNTAINRGKSSENQAEIGIPISKNEMKIGSSANNKEIGAEGSSSFVLLCELFENRFRKTLIFMGVIISTAIGAAISWILGAPTSKYCAYGAIAGGVVTLGYILVKRLNNMHKEN